MKIIKSTELGKSFCKNAQPREIEVVKRIVDKVRLRGDSAVRKFTKEFDGFSPARFEVTKKDIQVAYGKVDRETVWALRKAAENIRFFAKEQLKQVKGFSVRREGMVFGQRVVPLQSVGCYVPGGRYPLPSTALMCVIPAKVAGVENVIVCSPKIRPETLVACDIAGADRVFGIGGAQAIAAMAYGTKTVPKVDKIVGPGNMYVTAAKKEVYGEVGIDFLAGPSEVLIIADGNANPAFVAADLLAQAEHDTQAKANLITTSKGFAQKVISELDVQLQNLATRKVAGVAIRKGRIILAKNLEEAALIANAMAPEHLELQTRAPEKIVPRLANYGSLFIGDYSAEVFGDYSSGTNHALPTNGASRYASGLSVKDFVKLPTFQKIGRKASQGQVKIAARLARAEGLEAHERAALIRGMDM